MSQSTAAARRTPVQARASATVDTFLEAAARILESGDRARFTTNHIAERAGYSIGTLYGYLPNKRALLREMALREAERKRACVLRDLNNARADFSAEDIVRVRLVLRAALRPFGERSMLRTALMKLMMKDRDMMAVAEAAQQSVLDGLLREIARQSNGAMAEIGADKRFVLYAAISGAILAASAHRTDLFATRAFEDDLVQLVMTFLRPS